MPPIIESTKVVEPATITVRLAEEPSRPFNSDDYFARLGAFLDTMRPNYVGFPMIRDKLIAHATPTSEGVIDPNNLVLIPHGGTSATVSGDEKVLMIPRGLEVAWLIKMHKTLIMTWTTILW